MEPVSIAITVTGWILSSIISRLLDGAVEKWAELTHLGAEVDALKKKLQEMVILLDNADRSNLKNWALLNYVSDLQQAAYDAEDLLEELDYYRLKDIVSKSLNQTNVSKTASRKTIMVGALSRVPKISCRYAHSIMVKEPCKPSIPKLDKLDISKRIMDIVKKLDQNGEVVNKALSLENLGRIAEALSLESLRQVSEKLFNKTEKLGQTSQLENVIKYDSSTIFGREKEKDSIVHHLLESNNSGGGNIWVLPIVGIGGVGKTTLAKLVYNHNDVKECFGNKRMWISVTPNMDEKNLLEKMMNILSDDKPDSGIGGDLEDQHAFICAKLESRKVLLVVDNLCPEDPDNDDRWICLRKLFRETKENGTKILVTTRHLSFAEKIHTIKPIKLGCLERNELEKLYDACAFRDDNMENYPFLHGLRQRFINNLHGYPLEVKTIGAVLRKKLDFEHWNTVLDSNEWKNPINNEDGSKHIMASLKISYQYLPSDLKKCFSYCALFPKNFKFSGDNLINLWMAQGFIYSKNGYKCKVSGRNSLDELVGRGLFEEVSENIKSQKSPTTYYRMHELVYDLAKLISYEEFLTIDGSDIETIGNSIRHISIITPATYECDNSTQQVLRNFEKQMEKIVENLDISKLRTLILIGKYDSNFARTFQNLFKKAKYLRVLRLSMKSSVIDSLLYNFSNSILLRYLKLDQFLNSSDIEQKSNNNNVRKLVFRLYHLETLDISKWYGDFNLSEITHRLISLRRFYAQGRQLAKISKIGRLTYLEELPEFMVQNKKGFDIGQIGELKELGGSLRISNLQYINSKEEATNAKLACKRELRDLSLSWSSSTSGPQPDPEAILNSLEPHPNIANLDIHQYPGTKFPNWIVNDRTLRSLQSLCLINCSNLDVLPQLGHLPVLNKLQLKGMNRVKKITTEFYGDNTEAAFRSLSEMVFSDMERWDEWVGIDRHEMFPFLKKLEILNCPLLCELPKNCFPCLKELRVECCQKLVLPSLPHTQTLNDISISDGLDPLKKLCLSQQPNGLSLSIEWMTERKTLYKNMLFFSNLKALVELTIKGCSIACLPWEGLQELVMLKRLIIKDLVQNTQINRGNWVLPKSLELLEISSKYVTGLHVSEWLLELPSLLTFVLKRSDIDSFEIENDPITNKERPSTDEAKLRIFPHLLGSLKEMSIIECRKLVSFFLPQNGFSGFASLKKLTIKNNSKLRSLLVANDKPDEISLLPPSLLELELDWLPENMQSRLQSNLSRLTHLKLDSIIDWKSLSMDNFVALKVLIIENCIAMSSLQGVTKLGSLRVLKIFKCPELAAAWGRALQNEINVTDKYSLQLEKLVIDDISFLTEGICRYLSTLENLVFNQVKVVELTEEQKQSLYMLTSIRRINFESCLQLRSLPNNLYRLRALSSLEIRNCPGIESLPDDLPSLREVSIDKSNTRLVEF